ncbi:PREDICTED: uncharacterized protein LOC109157265 [Ipomoea nil]|uniref:uncharacterized protein LOC109157265 n=1 Tax=Ipomoea nil TaxID=35883 RepID=UPI0009015842|nr:PREDICTED: uncharacterized protein LOC109157265 [Ipomoea nil]
MGFINGTNPCPPAFLPVVADIKPQPNPAHAVWYRHDKALMPVLISSLSEEVMHLAIGRRTSREVWLSIEQSLASSSRARSLNFLDQLQSLRQGDSSIADYIGRARVVTKDLALAGRKVGLDEMNLYVFRGLQPEYQNLTTSRWVCGQPVTLTKLIEFLGDQEFI